MPLPFPPNHEVYMRYGATMRNGVHRGNGIPFPVCGYKKLMRSLLLSYKSSIEQGNKSFTYAKLKKV